MTVVLFEKFKQRFPPIKNHDRVSIYEAYERIYLSIIDRQFIGAPDFNSEQKIKDLASKTFDVNFVSKTFEEGHKNKLYLIFEPIIFSKMSKKSFLYNSSYSGHSIDINLPSFWPEITISTGNRGRTNLSQKQRDKYYNFVEEIYNLFLENAKNKRH